jgi:prepilin-type N-terminal cleavage/methylation domain-containing protein
MFTRVKNKKGFTLIELMIVVAIVGILAAIAIPAYLDYTVKAKLTEVSAAMDALAQSASEYHASTGYFPEASGDYSTVSGFAAVSDEYVGAWTYAKTDDNNASFTANLANLNPVTGCTLVLNVRFYPDEGYEKSWNDDSSTVEPKFMPRK